MDTKQKLLTDIVRFQLYGGEKPQAAPEDAADLMKEAKAQTVTALVFPYLKDLLREASPEMYQKANEDFFVHVIQNTNNFREHTELHHLMTERGLPYCTLKGLASARYYPQASLRVMGDVDFFVYERDFAAARQAVLEAGFSIDHGDDPDSVHIAFQRPPMSVWEQHRRVNGVPEGKTGQRILSELDKIIETSVLAESDGAVCRVPDDFHHGLVMLLHMISHMTSEGIGLRHLCDWAVFAQRFDSAAFASMFEKKLRAFGLWRFAQIMTLVSQRYLGVDHKEWAENPEVTEEQLEEVITDIMDGGNFGKKDLNRYREIKFISNRGDRTVDSRNIFSQAFSTLNGKTEYDYPFTRRHRILLPLGWIAEGVTYLRLLASGRRKSQGTGEMLREAAKRKSIYSRMRLFEKDRS